ncbi:hypothetical protein BcDW1_9912 [Botrytis cinerea BcDW1]|uniref:Uncharacterized protein n=1 Tax=Botryotinia fuckeliana (strain BcDW1) TaxID=1290391 RepID=M7UDB9_BOTF1|nr:hypothetical protein BcDW1_9912 [Botrytis cinerea BcDW1]
MPITQQREVYINIKKTPLEHGAILYGNVSLSAMDDLPLDDDDDDDDAFDKQRSHNYVKAQGKFLTAFPTSSMKKKRFRYPKSQQTKRKVALVLPAG